MPDRSRPGFVRYVAYETLIVLGAIAGILAFLSPLVGLVWAVVLIAFVVLVAITVALVIRPTPGQAPAQAGPTTEAPAKKPHTEPTPVRPPAPTQPEIDPALSRPFAHPAPDPFKDEHLKSRFGSAYLKARAAEQARAAQVTPPPPPPPRFVEEQVAVGPVIEVHDVASVRLPLKKGDRLYGHLREKDGFEFTWTIVNLKNLGLAERGEAYDYEVGEEDVPSATVEWTAPSDGPWFLMFDAYRKQYVRQVVVELWRRFPAGE